MDVKTSRKEEREQPYGTVEILMDNITDLYPIFGPDNLTIVDLEILDDPADELLDRAMFAILKQRGNDPLDLLDGNQIEECYLGEVSPIALIGQMSASVLEEGPGVKAVFGTSLNSNGKEYLTVSLTLVSPI